MYYAKRMHYIIMILSVIQQHPGKLEGLAAATIGACILLVPTPSDRIRASAATAGPRGDVGSRPSLWRLPPLEPMPSPLGCC